jgi:hypothetical protein
MAWRDRVPERFRRADGTAVTLIAIAVLLVIIGFVLF